MAKRGPKPKGKLGTDERAKFLELLSKGKGINLALAEMKVHKRRYYLTLRSTKGFRRAVKSAVACANEKLISLRYDKALGGDDKAQEYLITRYDKGRQFERDMRLRRAELAKQDELASRLKSLQDDREGGQAGGRRRTQPPQED